MLNTRKYLLLHRMGYRLFLDDVRTVDMVYPKLERIFKVVRSYNECTKHIKKYGLPVFMSFDNDLGEDKNKKLLPDGYAVAKWLVNKSKLDLTNFRFKVHSQNPVAKKQIESLLNNYIEFSKKENATKELAKKPSSKKGKLPIELIKLRNAFVKTFGKKNIKNMQPCD